jgi:hypothetical protein
VAQEKDEQKLIPKGLPLGTNGTAEWATLKRMRGQRTKFVMLAACQLAGIASFSLILALEYQKA